MGQEQHPMVPVPEAIRTVIRETSRVLLSENGKPNPSVTIPANAPWSDILGQVLHEDVKMKAPGYPPYNASIMDGYAVRTTECATSGETDNWTHRVVDRVYAGDQPATKNDSGTGDLPPAYYITTGAVVPDSYDCVVPIEVCQVSEDKQFIRVGTDATIEAKRWIRPIGCDLPEDSVVLPAGHVMDPVAMGLLKQSGADTITVKRPLVVGVLSTGNELILGDKNDQAQVGQIPDVNRPILLNLLTTFGNCKTMDLGMERDDDIHAMAKTIDGALENCDVIITTGGISMGETDIVEQVLVEHCNGKLHFGRMLMKPGKPTTFVSIKKGEATRLVFAMPGNPVSATVCTQLLVRPCLDLLFQGVGGSAALSGDFDANLKYMVDNALVHPEVNARLSHDVKLDPQRPEYHRVTVQKASDGTYEVTTTGVQRSSRLASCRDAQAILALPVGGEKKPAARKGEFYTALLLSDLRGIDQTKVKDAKHLIPRARDSRVAVVEVVPKDKSHLSALDSTCELVKAGLSGSRSGNVVIVSKKTFSGGLDEIYSAVTDSNDADVVVVSCVTFDGSFNFHLDVASTLRGSLTKPAAALELQARQGASAEDPTAALFEAVVGFAPEGKGSMVVCLSDRGVQGGVANVRGLLKHALNVGRGKQHNHHHTHKNHDHSKPQ